MGIRRFDDKLVQGDHLSLEDKGIVTKGAKTRNYAVRSRYDHSLLGYIKFKAQWRQYTFFPLNCILNKDCLREAANLCEELTAAHREKREPFPVSVEKQVVEADTLVSSL